MANYMAYYISMKSANIAEFKDHLGKYLSIVERGEKVQICRRNVPLAMVVPSKQKTVATNKTQLGITDPIYMLTAADNLSVWCC